MPFLKSYTVFPDTMVGLWTLEESTEDLVRMLGESSQESAFPNEIKLDKRRREFAARTLLMRAMGNTSQLDFLPNGKPVVHDGYVSFSHSSEKVVYAHSARPVGVDIQRPHPKLIRIASKFCNPDEGGPQSDLLHLTTLWTVKEAVFKIYGQGVNFKDVRLLTPKRAIWQTALQSLHLDIATFEIKGQILSVSVPILDPTDSIQNE